MTRRIAILAAITTALAVPSLASAHTGSVSCTDKGITFTYQANFAHDTTVTETVQDAATGKGSVQTFLVHANTAATDTIPSPATSVTASASWSDGNAAGHIGPVALTCTVTPITPDACIPQTIVTKTIYTPGPATIQYIDVPGATTFVDRVKTKIVYRTRVKWKTRIKLVPYKLVHQPKHPIHKTPGVTG